MANLFTNERGRKLVKSMYRNLIASASPFTWIPLPISAFWWGGSVKIKIMSLFKGRLSRYKKIKPIISPLQKLWVRII